MFVKGVCQRFGDIREETVVVDFTNLQQTGSLQDYAKKFEHNKALLSIFGSGLSESFFIGVFCKGLKEKLKLAVLAQHPATVKIATQIEFEQDSIFESLLKDMRDISKFTSPAPRSNQVVTGVQNNRPKVVSDNNQVPHKFLTKEEMRVRREAGLCFNYDERWVAGHKCKATTLHYDD